MDSTYLIEIRLGRTKWRIKQEILSLGGTFGIEEHIEQHPHVTIFGPLVLNTEFTEEQLLIILGNISSRYAPVPFLIDGWEKREGMHGSVIAFAVRPSGPLISLTRAIAESLLPVSSSMNAWDPYPEEKWFHVTIANHLDPGTAEKIFGHIVKDHAGNPGRLRQWCDHIFGSICAVFFGRAPEFRPVLLDETGLRLTVMKGDEILAEFDFSRKEWITDCHDQSCDSWEMTLREYRRNAGFECSAMVFPEADDIFVISDLHLGHANIIRYCSRPFRYSDAAGMDSILIRNWNLAVGSDTQVFHIGDLRYGRDVLPAQHYVRQLSGKIAFISGNHDDPELNAEKTAVLDYDGIRFFLVHDPADAPPAFDGWVIHGHHHNNDLRTYPYLDPVARRINVSAEVIGYVPVSLREICNTIRNVQKNEAFSPVLLRYPHHA
ncbi:MAG: 2'-5' RNA ligase family protein [Methanoregula sp.]|jgi:calcineurin-like phosphoesterase family protein|nr:2'-5' RNA ligase family protein [Methanoregula sp.]